MNYHHTLRNIPEERRYQLDGNFETPRKIFKLDIAGNCQYRCNFRALPTACLFCFGQFVFNITFSRIVSVSIVSLRSRLAGDYKKDPRYKGSLACTRFLLR